MKKRNWLLRVFAAALSLALAFAAKAEVVVEQQKCLGGSGDDRADSIQQTSDGGYIVAGYTSSTNRDVVGNHGSYDAWVVKFGLTIATTTLPNGTVGTPYSATLKATGWSGSVTWTLESGSLPSGLTLSPSSGTISGTPSASGTANFTVKAASGTESVKHHHRPRGRWWRRRLQQRIFQCRFSSAGIILTVGRTEEALKKSGAEAPFFHAWVPSPHQQAKYSCCDDTLGNAD
ncbi:MAG: Ig domain-containing protein [Synergistaceae bacterium]|nr:Ig domain-containing protein [Synergistaceae bacterium]